MRFRDYLAIFIALASIIRGSALRGQPPVTEDHKLTLTVNLVGLRNKKGLLHVSLFGSANKGKGFPGSDKDAVSVQEISTSTAAPVSSKSSDGYKLSVTFPGLTAGTYAVAMYHDENSNHKMDTYWYGKPREGAAASNNPHPSMRAPYFKEASFALKADSTVELKLWYP